MKIKSILTAVVILFLTGSCSRTADLTNDPAQTATSGTWRVTLFSERGVDETTDFAGYSFTFSSNGTVTAVNGANSKSGTWSSSSSKFNIDLGPKTDSNKPLGELTDDWQIISVSETEIRLTDDNASRNELLTFSKN